MITMISILLYCMCLLSCSDNGKEASMTTSGQETENRNASYYTELWNQTTSVPSEYYLETTLKGKVEQINYVTKDYVDGNGSERPNTAYIYLPYGYDDSSNQCYNVFYFIHGYGETAASLFQNEDGMVCNLLDHMMANCDMAPTIVVSTSYDYGDPVESYPDEDPYCKAFPQELVNDLIPLVESRYHTYTKATDLATIEFSREHRAIGGFSMGAVSTWYAMEQSAACFKYYMPISSDCWSLGRFAGSENPTETADYLATIVRSPDISQQDYYIWACSGSKDVAYDRIWTQVQAMSKIKDVFSVPNLTFHEQEGARHEFSSIAGYLYNALPFFFPHQIH